MRSELMKKGIQKAPHRSLFKAAGLTDEELARPIIGIANSANEIIPGHIHLDRIADAVKKGIIAAGGTPSCPIRLVMHTALLRLSGSMIGW